jgi:hypothetical protein
MFVRRPLGFVLAIAIVSLSATATAGAAVVPPENSAATQYTETYPTTGGNTETDRTGDRTPAQALGKENARKLEGAGPEGAAAAQLAAETAPAGAGQGAARGGHGGMHGDGAGHAMGDDGGMAADGGSSGLGEVIGSATGSSDSGELGLLLPLIILATLVLSGLYAWRCRRTTA